MRIQSPRQTTQMSKQRKALRRPLLSDRLECSLLAMFRNSPAAVFERAQQHKHNGNSEKVVKRRYGVRVCNGSAA
jgi:hypothetical protein